MEWREPNKMSWNSQYDAALKERIKDIEEKIKPIHEQIHETAVTNQFRCYLALGIKR